MRALRKKEAVTIKDTDDDVDDMPFMPRKKLAVRAEEPKKDYLSAFIGIKEAPKQEPVSNNPVIADSNQEKDWLLDPINLYMRGMAQRREQMKKLQQ